MNDSEGKCGKCKEILNKHDNVVFCSGLCACNFHLKCATISLKDITVIQTCKGLKWFCENCILHFDMYSNVIAAMTQLRADVTSELNELKKIVNDNDNQFKHTSEQNSLQKSYADVTSEEVVIIKPKNKQESKKTKEAIQKNLKPASLEVGITQMKSIKEGGVVIKCKTKEEQEKIKKAAEKKLTKSYQITAPRLKHPCIKVLDIEEKYENADLIEYIHKQNINIQHDTFKMEVKVLKKMKSRYMAIIECDPETCKRVLDEKYLYINWSRCRVYEYISVFRCFKCGGFNHHADKCEREEKCLRCTDTSHKTDQCDKSINKCINCIEVNAKSNLSLDINHFVFDKCCPVYLKRIEVEKQKIEQLTFK